MQAEELRKLAALQAARRAAEEAERLAREAEEKEREAINEAKMGVETDVVSATTNADSAFNEFSRSVRGVARAEKATNVKIKTDARRGLSFRRKEVLSIATMEDAQQAIEVMGLTDEVVAAILTSARKYREAIGDLPDGITVTYERII